MKLSKLAENPRTRPATLLLVLILVLSATSLAGCSSVRQIPVSPGQGGSQNSQVQATLVDEHDHWGISRGCYYSVQYQVFNTGNTTARNVKLYVQLTHINDNAVRDSKEIFVGNLGPGASQTVTAELDGECTKDYNTQAIPVYDA